VLSVAHLDAEVFSAFGHLHRNGELTADAVTERLALLDELAIERLGITARLSLAAWGMRENVALRDALYVAAAHAVGPGPHHRRKAAEGGTGSHRGPAGTVPCRAGTARRRMSTATPPGRSNTGLMDTGGSDVALPGGPEDQGM